MDITVYDKLYEALETALNEFNTKSGFKAQICPYEPSSPQYPLIILTEVRNQPKTKIYSRIEQISSLGYSVDIFAKSAVITTPDKKKVTVNKQQICRQLMQFITDFMQWQIGMNLISKNEDGAVATQGELYRIILVFQQSHNDNREYFF